MADSFEQKGRIPISNVISERILEKVRSNRLTIVVGATGCGKSTLVPQLLLENMGSPILVTQPRRLAVVAVSSYVSAQRNTEIGKEVGYHVGQSRHATNETSLLFATAGILLEDLRSNGLETLTRYKVVLIDECHERSAESDLCLTIIKSFMKGHPNAYLRVILMSATFDHKRYTTFFQGIPGCEVIDTITLQSAESISAFNDRVQTYYLEDVFNMIPSGIATVPEVLQFQRKMKLDPEDAIMGEDRGKSLPSSLLIIIETLVDTLDHDEEPEAIFLIFAPTYRHLQQLYDMLSEGDLQLDVNVLHSSIDIEDCLQSMKSTNSTSETESSNGFGYFQSHPRRVLLASAIADSSVTIPGVSVVIDTCLALEVRWDYENEVNIPKAKWASKSICDQRQGRTGRTCPGKVFRLLYQGFYINNIDAWDNPQIQIASCRDEVLSLLSSTNKMMSDPQALLKRCMDPPPQQSLRKAIAYLKNIGACEEIISSRGRSKLAPTEYGRLLASLPFTITEANMALKGAKMNLLHEVILLISILTTRPFPIVHAFANEAKNEQMLQSYYRSVDTKDPKLVALSNFSAYLFWDLVWNRAREKACKLRFLRCTGGSTNNDTEEYKSEYDESKNNFDLFKGIDITENDKSAHDCNVWDWSQQIDDAHIEWCKRYYINPTSVRAISETIEHAFRTFYLKDFDMSESIHIGSQDAEPMWKRKISLPPESFGTSLDMFGAVYGADRGAEICRLLVAIQDQSSVFVNEMCNNGLPTQCIPTQMACIHFLRGNCIFGDSCNNAHSYTAPRPPCRFFASGSCSNSNCLYSHQAPTVSAPIKEITSTTLSGEKVLQWFSEKASQLLLFGEADFSFTRALEAMSHGPLIATTFDEIPLSEEDCDLSGLDATRCHASIELNDHSENDKIKYCAWNFPFTGEDENVDVHQSLLSGTFLSLACYFDNKSDLYESEQVFEFGVALQGDQFSRWSLKRSAQRAGFQLAWWDIFDCNFFPEYCPKREDGSTFPVMHARFYVFRYIINRSQNEQFLCQSVKHDHMVDSTSAYVANNNSYGFSFGPIIGMTSSSGSLTNNEYSDESYSDY